MNFKEEFEAGLAETCGAYVKTGDGSGAVGAVEVRYVFVGGWFCFHAGNGLMRFSCDSRRWDAWQARDLGRDLGKRVAEAAAFEQADKAI